MFAKMTLDRVWPSRFGGLCSAGLPLAPQKPAAAAPATNASAGLTPTSLRIVAPINVNGLSVKVAKGEAATIVADAVLNNMDLLSNVIKCALESNAQAPTLASVAQAWTGQVCCWRQQIVQCIVSSPVALLHTGGVRHRATCSWACRSPRFRQSSMRFRRWARSSQTGSPRVRMC